ncbi:DUF2528 family protein [Lysobacter sp. CA199]|uniref:DUF2528 family protein n=1 Tax=Lysobacter sp. CA199 TaxID=3455608 RepID=UPI003F8D5C3B
MKKRYCVSDADTDMSVTIEIDHDVIDPYAAEINNFWTGSAERLAAANGDLTVVVARLAGASFLDFVLNGTHVHYALQDKFDALEGWPGQGIRIIDFDASYLPEFDDVDLVVVEVPR